MAPLPGESDRRAKPRLRFDKVALRFVEGLRAGLAEAVPDGATLALTATAPIRRAAKTAAALEASVRNALARRCGRVEVHDTLNGNHLRARLLNSGATGAAKVIGCVHNPDTDPQVLLHIAQSLLQHIGAATARPAPAVPTRWLVLIHANEFPHGETYAHIHHQLAIPSAFETNLMLWPSGRVEPLGE